MKNILILTGLSIIFLTSCYREPEPNPYADFGVDYVYVEPGEVVFFSNYSQDADYYEWDFGDGYGSNQYQPSHAYSGEGVYTVRLAAYNGNKVDYTYLEIEVYLTTLEVEVIDYDSETYVPGVEITVYDNYYDWYNLEKNYVAYGITGTDGVVIFKGVDNIAYYIDAWNPHFDNVELAKDDINFVLTAPLEHAMHNIFTAYVDYYPEGKVLLKSSRMRVKSTGDRPKRSAKNLTRVKEK